MILEMMDAELEETLGYSKYDHRNKILYLHARRTSAREIGRTMPELVRIPSEFLPILVRTEVNWPRFSAFLRRSAGSFTRQTRSRTSTACFASDQDERCVRQRRRAAEAAVLNHDTGDGEVGDAIRNWGAILAQLMVYYGERVPELA
jgi:hypothetical protein